jgi:hypothetical protein
MEQNGALAEAHAQRRGAVVVRGAAAHPAVATPSSAKTVDDLPRAALETLRLMALGHDFSFFHAPSAASSPRPRRCVFLQIMFSICSLSIRPDKESSEMILRVVSIAIGMVVAMPAHGQAQAQPEAVAAAADDQHQGYRLAQTADGFQLVEHGVWEVPAASAVQASVPSPITSASDGMRGQESGKPRGLAGPNGFRRAAYLPHVYAAEARFGLPAGLLDALIWTESRYNPFAVSRAGAAGLGQLMPGTARELGVSNRFDPLPNLAGAARYLRQMLDRFGTVHMALAAYNAGPGAVERAGGIPLNGETPAYVRDVLRRWRP